MKRFPATLKFLTMMLLSAIAGGCALSPTEKIEIVRVSIVPFPEEAAGFFYIATNTPVKVGLEGKPDYLEEKDLGGWFLIHPADLAAIRKILQEKQNGEHQGSGNPR